MKRFAAMLLALLMLLPGFTHAEEEGYSVSVTFSMDREAAGSMLTSMLGGEPSGLDSMAEALSEMIGSIVLKASGLSSEQLTQVDFRIDLKDTPVMDMLMSTDNLSGTVRLASDSLWPGHALFSAMTAEEMAATLSIQKAWEKTDFGSVLADLRDCVETWSAGVPCKIEHGAYVGDLFEDGVQCETYLVDDRDLSLLADLLLDKLKGYDLPLEAFAEMYLNGEHPLALVRSSVHQVSLENRYAYQLRRILDADGQLLCLSLTVLDNGVQVSTLSAAPLEHGVKLLWGYGMQGGNRYLECTLTDLSESDTKRLDSMVKGYLDQAKAGYRAASAGLVVYEASGSLEITGMPDGSAQWQAEWTAGLDGGNERLSVTGLWQAQTEEISVDIVLGERVNAAPGVRITLRGGPAEVSPADLSALKEIDMLDDDPVTLELTEQLLKDAAQSLGVKLFKLIPAPLMTLLFMN